MTDHAGRACRGSPQRGPGDGCDQCGHDDGYGCPHPGDLGDHGHSQGAVAGRHCGDLGVPRGPCGHGEPGAHAEGMILQLGPGHVSRHSHLRDCDPHGDHGGDHVYHEDDHGDYDLSDHDLGDHDHGDAIYLNRDCLWSVDDILLHAVTDLLCDANHDYHEALHHDEQDVHGEVTLDRQDPEGGDYLHG